MAKSGKQEPLALERLREAAQALAEAGEQRIDHRTAIAMRATIDEIVVELRALNARLDPVKEPRMVFDPQNPDVVGAFIGVAMLAQQRHVLGEVAPFYGSGIYALYYGGNFAPYQSLVGTEHPIYVGKADPADRMARQPREQGQRLHGRLGEHARSIRKAESTLRPGDFMCRYLVVQSGWESGAEKFLIDLFKPIWNNETGICHGIGKHGDDPETRANLRSPWDTMHPGRDWAWRDSSIHDQVPKARIEAEIAQHFEHNPPFRDESAILRHFFERLRQ